MFLVVSLVILGVAAWAWTQLGPLYGILAVPATYLVLTLIVGGVERLSPGHKEREEFRRAFEGRGGRMGLERGSDNAAARELYDRWQRDGSGLPADVWLDDQGLTAPPMPGGVKITSGWRGGVVEWPPEHPESFVASRSFDYEKTGVAGGVAGMSHRKLCPHRHQTDEDARSCTYLTRLTQPPSIDDVGRPDSGLEWNEGEAYTQGQATGVVGRVAPVRQGLAFGDSAIPWADVDEVAWGSDSVSFHVHGDYMVGSDDVSQLPLDRIYISELGKSKAQWREYVIGLGVADGDE